MNILDKGADNISKPDSDVESDNSSIDLIAPSQEDSSKNSNVLPQNVYKTYNHTKGSKTMEIDHTLETGTTYNQTKGSKTMEIDYTLETGR